MLLRHFIPIFLFWVVSAPVSATFTNDMQGSPAVGMNKMIVPPLYNQPPFMYSTIASGYEKGAGQIYTRLPAEHSITTDIISSRRK